MIALEELKNPTIPIICLLDWATKYLDFCMRTKAGATFEEKAACFKRFFKHVNPNLKHTQLKRSMVLEYIIWRAENKSGHAANVDRKNLVAAWNWARRNFEFSDINPCDVGKMAEIRKPVYVPPVSDFWKVYEACGTFTDDQELNERNQVMLLMYHLTAARGGEILGDFTWSSNIDFNKRVIRLYTKKRADGSLECDDVAMPRLLYDSLLGIYVKRKSDWVFPNKKGQPYKWSRWKLFHKLCVCAGVLKFSARNLRHLTATDIYQNGGDTAVAQSILRHKSLRTTENYVRPLKERTKTMIALDDLSSKKPDNILMFQKLQKEKAPNGTPKVVNGFFEK